MNIEPIAAHDLDEIRHFQPDGWPDILPEFRYYIASDFCFPIKATMDDRIVGIGASIELRNSCWLAHIIVDPQHRNKGIGFQIVEILIANLDPLSPVLLIATKPGEPLYRKAGFREVTEYVFFERQFKWTEYRVSENLGRRPQQHTVGFYG